MSNSEQRLQLNLTGLLQGIGFRPYVYRLATQHELSGWVANNRDQVLIEVEGSSEKLALFLTELQQNVPACGHIAELQQRELTVTEQQGFSFKASLNDQESAAFVCPDIAVCADCVKELFDKNNRRYQHPFISCCHCGPRYSVMTGLPYDREQTALRDFPLCAECANEYENPNDRRFFAQTLACPACGPQLSFCDATGKVLAEKQDALLKTVDALAKGQIIAVKGIGGFQIMLDAENNAAVKRLRHLKQRASKPFAVMVSSITDAELLSDLTVQERTLLQSATAPIVLVNAKPSLVLNNAAPNQALLGLLLPAAPVQHLLLAELNKPLIATSGNRYGEPICIDNAQAFKQLAGLVDGFLVHDRAILRPLDDSIVRVIADIPTVLRRARGYVPTPIHLPYAIPTTLAVGGQLKNTVAIANQRQAILSQHLGDLHQLETIEQHHATIADLKQFYALKPEHIVCDTHSDYASSQTAQVFHLPTHTVQHHYAHVLSCMAEHQLKPPVLGIAWDGVGLGLNNELWGGECLLINDEGWQRIAHCRPFPLVGGTVAIKEPRRAALGLLYQAFGDAVFGDEFARFLTAFSQTELKLLRGLLTKKLNCPMTSSIGRVFDGFASLLGLCQINEFEGQAAMMLEALAVRGCADEQIHEHTVFDWQVLLHKLCSANYQAENLAAELHYLLAAWLFTVAKIADVQRIALSGGCFQNAYLVEAIIKHPEAKDYQIYRHAQIPPNDGGLALGQIYSRVIHPNLIML